MTEPLKTHEWDEPVWFTNIQKYGLPVDAQMTPVHADSIIARIRGLQEKHKEALDFCESYIRRLHKAEKRVRELEKLCPDSSSADSVPPSKDSAPQQDT